MTAEQTHSTVIPARLKRFAGLHEGKRAFLVGNGPSLRPDDLDRLRGEYTFAMNRISLIYPRTLWRPRYFLCTTTNVQWPDWKRDIMASVDAGIESFVWERLVAHFDSRDVNYIRCSHGEQIVAEGEASWWSDDIGDRVCKFGTSMLPVMQIAAYMGFKELCLLGCDMNFTDSPKGADANHFDPNYGTPGLESARLNINMLAAHRLAQTALSARGVHVINATRGGALDVYERRSLDDLVR